MLTSECIHCAAHVRLCVPNRYILVLLLLVIYMFAVLGVIMLGANDPANFGTVTTAMLTLFQVSTLTNWASIALISFHGCDV